ncbi:MAG TPA: BA14K family protein [Bradyrhizobium sp.]|nr:BA14K family protein [Bradyrhizobium sp.]
MSHFKLLGAVAILATAIASPVPAQQVISEPGYCAQFYPNANCQNKGYGNPYTGSSAYYQRGMDPVHVGGMYAGGGSSPCAQYRSYDPASGTYIGRNGRRIACP